MKYLKSMGSIHLPAFFANKKSLALYLAKVNTIALLLSGIAMYFFDYPLAQFFANGVGRVSRPFFLAITDIALAAPYFVVALLALIVSHLALRYLAPDKSPFASIIKTWANNLLIALLTSGVLVHLFKFSVGRKRPYEDPALVADIYQPFNTHWAYHSFPSGHSQVIFTVACYLMFIFPKARIALFTFAAFIAFSRVAVTDHFLSDIIFGSCIGYTGTNLALYWRKNQLPRIFS